MKGPALFDDIGSAEEAVAAVQVILAEVIAVLDRYGFEVAAAHVAMGSDSLPKDPTDASRSIN